MPVVVPTIPMSSFFTDVAAGGAARGVTPVQSGSTSRIGSSIYASSPGGTHPTGSKTSLESAWGFMAGKAPPGTSGLTVAANGTTFIRGNLYARGIGGAYGCIYVTVDEFESVGPVREHDPSISLPAHDYETVAEIGPGETAARRSLPPDPPFGPPETAPFRSRGLAWTQRFGSAWTTLLDLGAGLVYAYQVVALDNQPAATMLVTPITPGLSYLWWIACYQFVGVANPGTAVSNISFDFGPVFFAFT